ncbi:MAG: DNA mismatch repair endonuclease MutL [Clostridia bacterium]|nr:DNA mismatch repair endonuclease MutL [Clostridia bacterium]
MQKIKMLDKKMIELIAAGEVVERPASVIKELVENAIDANAKNITVEIQNGGILYMRVTDNGTGIQKDDIRTAFLSHATSKISKASDLYSIGTLGFRGEALAAISSVSKVELFTRTENENTGTHYTIEGGNETLFEDIGCPRGTTFIIRDIFYNTPARMKFLKKDVSEANLISALLDRIAMSHPEVAIKFIRDGKQVLVTPGDGKLESAVYSVQGREFFSNLIEIAKNNDNGIAVSGFIGKPTYTKSNRNGQFCYLNGRLVKSATVCAALEQAYKNSMMTGRFPVCVLNVCVPYDMVDVNVHPAKTEVRFTNEKLIFDSVYYAVKATLTQLTERPAVELPEAKSTTFTNMTAEEFKNEFAPRSFFDGKRSTQLRSESVFEDVKATQAKIDIEYEAPAVQKQTEQMQSANDDTGLLDVTPPPAPTVHTMSQSEQPQQQEEDPVFLVGEAFKTYIIAQKGSSLFVIDKHAAHERIIYNKLKQETTPQKQLLITPETVVLNKEEYMVLIERQELLDEVGFEIEDLSDGIIMVRSVPASLCGDNMAEALSQIADSLSKGGAAMTEKQERLYCTVACRAAIKAGDRSTEQELRQLAAQVLGKDGVMHCPHGRPVAFELKQRDLEKQFGRLQ